MRMSADPVHSPRNNRVGFEIIHRLEAIMAVSEQWTAQERS